MKKATKASDNRYYQARFSAAQKNTDFESREAASDVVGIDRTRLARIELGNVTPYADEVVSMSKCYNAPELCYNYCSNECPIGRLTMKEVEINSFDRLSLKMLGSLNDIENLRASIINISADGQVDIGEQEEFKQILESLDLISNNAKALELWAKKNIKNIEIRVNFNTPKILYFIYYRSFTIFIVLVGAQSLNIIQSFAKP